MREKMQRKSGEPVKKLDKLAEPAKPTKQAELAKPAESTESDNDSAHSMKGKCLFSILLTYSCISRE